MESNNASVHCLVVPNLRLKAFRRSFSYADPHKSNELPVSVKTMFYFTELQNRFYLLNYLVQNTMMIQRLNQSEQLYSSDLIRI